VRKRNYLLPNTFTALNLLSGFLAVINAANGQYVSAAWLIVLAALFDAFDGRVARSTQTFSRFGVEADSLADMVSFGVAPAFLAYQIGLARLGHLGLVVTFVPLLSAAVRLARFNVLLRNLKVKRGFLGLPAPSAALAVAAYVIAYSGNKPLRHVDVLAVLCVLLGLLMVSTFHYAPIPKLSLKAGTRNSFGVTFLFVWMALSLMWPKIFMFPMWMVYILSGPFDWLRKNTPFLVSQGELSGFRGESEEEVEPEERPV